MAWKKANRDLIKLLEETMLKYGCDRRMMFGSPTFFINNNMFAGVHEDTVIIRLSAEDREELLARYGEVKPFEPMMGRIMKEYAALPVEICSNTMVFREWLDRSFKYASTLSRKEPKRSRKK